MLNANCLKKIEWLSREILISNMKLGFELGFAWWLWNKSDTHGYTAAAYAIILGNDNKMVSEM